MANLVPERAESALKYFVDQKNGDRMIKQLLNSVTAKYHDLSVSRRSITCVSLRLWQIIIDLLATDKSRYFAQPSSIIIVNWPSYPMAIVIYPQDSSIQPLNNLCQVS